MNVNCLEFRKVFSPANMARRLHISGKVSAIRAASRGRQDEPLVKNIIKLWQKLTKGDYEKNYTGAKATSSCIVCGRPAKKFRDAAARLEYAISALCQNCQDEYLNGR